MGVMNMYMQINNYSNPNLVGYQETFSIIAGDGTVAVPSSPMNI
jgi:hypothetical protein